MVRKASGGWRPVIDLKQLNHHIDAPHFRTTKQQDFQGRSLSLPQLLHVGDPPQIECTMTGGYASLPGLQGEDLIRLSRVTGPV